MQIIFRNTLFVFMLVNAAAVYSFAQTLPAKIREMSKGADVILTGKVVRNISFWNDGKTKIFTKSSLQVDEFIKGSDTKNAVDVVCPGGEVGEVGELYTHMPKLMKNEDVLLFLTKDLAGSSYKVLGGEDGKIPVLTDAANGQQVTSTRRLLKSLKEEIKQYIHENK